MKGEYRVGTKKAQAICSFLEIEWNPKWLGIALKPIRRPQTDSQRGYYWMSLHAYGKHLGYTRGEVERWLHNAVLCEAYGTKGLRKIGESVVAIPEQRSSEADRDEYSELIEALISMAADSGYHIEEPRQAA